MVSGDRVPWSPIPVLLMPAQKTPTGLLGPGGRRGETAFSFFKHALIPSNEGMVIMLITVQRPRGTNRGRPWVMGKAANKRVPS